MPGVALPHRQACPEAAFAFSMPCACWRGYESPAEAGLDQELVEAEAAFGSELTRASSISIGTPKPNDNRVAALAAVCHHERRRESNSGAEGPLDIGCRLPDEAPAICRSSAGGNILRQRDVQTISPYQGRTAAEWRHQLRRKSCRRGSRTRCHGRPDGRCLGSWFRPSARTFRVGRGVSPGLGAS